jgi:hypothetical protein
VSHQQSMKTNPSSTNLTAFSTTRLPELGFATERHPPCFSIYETKPVSDPGVNPPSRLGDRDKYLLPPHGSLQEAGLFHSGRGIKQHVPYQKEGDPVKEAPS